MVDASGSSRGLAVVVMGSGVVKEVMIGSIVEICVEELSGR